MGKLIQKHQIQLPTDPNRELKYSGMIKTLWTQIQLLKVVLDGFDEIEKGMIAILEEIKSIIPPKQFPVLPWSEVNFRLSLISYKMCLCIVLICILLLTLFSYFFCPVYRFRQ